MSVTETAFSQLMAIAGRERPSNVTFEEGPPALKSKFADDEAVSAVIAAGASVAADLWAAKGGAAQEVRVNTREGGAALTGYTHQKFHDAARAPRAAGPGGDPSRAAVAGFKPIGRDGRYFYLHPSFPPGMEKLLKILGVENDPGAVSAAMLKREPMELEAAIAEAGACGALCRTPEEWDASEQGRILASRPVVEVTKIADGPPMPLPDLGDMPLSGVRVLDLTRVLAGPTCARTLAQYGADVLYITGADLPSAPSFVTDTNHGKLSAFLDLKAEAGRARLYELLETTDIFSQGYQTGTLERLGLSAVELAHRRPGLIYTSINAYGHEGPWRTRPGWEQLSQTVTGMAHVHGGYINEDKAPLLQPGAVADYTTGFMAAYGALLALQRRALYGGSYLVRVSLSQTAVWIRKLGISDARLEAHQALTPEETAGFLIDSDTGFGRVTHLRPPAQLSATPARWARPVVPLGTHEAVWP